MHGERNGASASPTSSSFTSGTIVRSMCSTGSAGAGLPERRGLPRLSSPRAREQPLSSREREDGPYREREDGPYRER